MCLPLFNCRCRHFYFWWIICRLSIKNSLQAILGNERGAVIELLKSVTFLYAEVLKKTDVPVWLSSIYFFTLLYHKLLKISSINGLNVEFFYIFYWSYWSLCTLDKLECCLIICLEMVLLGWDYLYSSTLRWNVNRFL